MLFNGFQLLFMILCEC